MIKWKHETKRNISTKKEKESQGAWVFKKNVDSKGPKND